MARRILIDTNIVVDWLRERPEPAAFIDGLDHVPVLSAVSVAELYGGVREGKERRLLDGLVAGSAVVPIDTELAQEGGLLWRRYRGSHGLDLPDALIAATAIVHRLRLATLNRKHFPMLADLVVPY